jgi:DNA-binding Lrp family transcriptional regulator
MKSKEKTMLQELRKNSRAALTYLAYTAGMPLSSAYNKLKELESSVIKKHTSLLDFRKLGFNSWNKLVLKINRPQRNELKSFLLHHKDVNSLFEVNNDYDFLVETFHRDQIEFKHFLEDLHDQFDIKLVHHISVVNDLQRERFLTK